MEATDGDEAQNTVALAMATMRLGSPKSELRTYVLRQLGVALAVPGCPVP